MLGCLDQKELISRISAHIFTSADVTYVRLFYRKQTILFL